MLGKINFGLAVTVGVPAASSGFCGGTADRVANVQGVFFPERCLHARVEGWKGTEGGRPGPSSRGAAATNPPSFRGEFSC